MLYSPPNVPDQLSAVPSNPSIFLGTYHRRVADVIVIRFYMDFMAVATRPPRPRVSRTWRAGLIPAGASLRISATPVLRGDVDGGSTSD